MKIDWRGDYNIVRLWKEVEGYDSVLREILLLCFFLLSVCVVNKGIIFIIIVGKGIFYWVGYYFFNKCGRGFMFCLGGEFLIGGVVCGCVRDCF